MGARRGYKRACEMPGRSSDFLPVPHRGWRRARRGAPWVQVCECGTWREAFLGVCRLGGEYMVLPADQTPDAVLAGRGSRGRWNLPEDLSR